MSWGFSGWSQVSNQELLEELKALKQRVQELEEQLKGKAPEGREGSADVQYKPIRRESEHVTNQMRDLEKKQGEMKGILDELAERVTVSGVLEIEAGYENTKYKVGDDEDSADLTLATAQLELEARIHEYVNAHVVLLWEEDDTEPIDLDEGTITLGAAENFPFYLLTGKFYPHVGEFNSYFITDPLTLEIGEVRESALAVGYLGKWGNISIGGFNGDIQSDDDDYFNSFWVDAQLTPPRGKLGPVNLTFGAAYFNNIADSDTLQDEVDVDELDSLVGGFSAHLIAEIGPFALSAEYLSAIDHFKAGELAFAVLDGTPREAKPQAWNVEAAYSFLERYQIAAKYEGSNDLFGLLPETRFGAAFSVEIFPGTAWSLEYMHGNFADNDEGLDEADTVTTQLAVEF